jgi:hypothetical protein
MLIVCFYKGYCQQRIQSKGHKIQVIHNKLMQPMHRRLVATATPPAKNVDRFHAGLRWKLLSPECYAANTFKKGLSKF